MRIQAKSRLLATILTPTNVDDAYTVGEVLFDNRKGLGATPSNANVLYLGCVALMPPSKFRELAAPGDRKEDAASLEQLMRQGRSIGCPFLILRVSKAGDDIADVKVVSHEGRARADACYAIQGDVPIPVHLFFTGEYDRARYVTRELLDVIDREGIIPEKRTNPVMPKISKLFWAGNSVF